MSRRTGRRGQDRVAEMERLYAQLPAIECKGLCAHSCGPIGMSDLERQRIEAEGVDITPLVSQCPALTILRRCSVYEIRPLICRLWGVVEVMPCEHGCRPEGGYLSEAEGLQLIREADRIGGRDQRARRERT